MVQNFYYLMDDGYPTVEMCLGIIRPELREIPNTFSSVDEYQAIHSNLLIEEFLKPVRNAIEEIRSGPIRKRLNNGWACRYATLSAKRDGLYTIHIDGPSRVPSFGNLLVFSRKEFRGDIFLGMASSDEHRYFGRNGDENDENINIDVSSIPDSCTRVCDHELDEICDNDGDDDSDDESDDEKSEEATKETTTRLLRVPVELKLSDSRNLKDGLFVMLEINVFFFMYQKVLKALNSLHEFTFPLKDTILRCMPSAVGRHNAISLPPNIFDFRSSKNLKFRNKKRFKKLVQELNLNDIQFSSLKATFENEVTLTQGPPGTGKTFFGVRLTRILLHILKRIKGTSEPILVICQTNRALDNFLQKLVDLLTKMKKDADKKSKLNKNEDEKSKMNKNHDECIVRVGGECKNLRITPYCLTERVCRIFFWRNLIKICSRPHQLCARKKYSCRIALGKVLVKLHKKRVELRTLKDASQFESENAVAIRQCKSNIRKHEKDIQQFYAKLEPLNTRHDIMMQCLRKASIIGMTTTGAAIRYEIIRELGIKIVIVEEAAAVLEAHIVASVPKSCECLIMLGDHKQLQPCLTNHLLEEYRLNVSLFERLINNGYPKKCFNLQYRMRPEIAKLVRNFYDEIDLENSDKTHDRPHIEGMYKDVFFVDYSYEYPNRTEYPGPTGSYSNFHETDELIKLAQYLVDNGHRPSDIGIIAMYGFQKRKLIQTRDQIERLKNIEIATVDSFQGRENEIILVSLVRSNDSGNIGFLSKRNRVCVALSRARSGLFIVGDMDCLTGGSKGDDWKEIRDLLMQQGSIGPIEDLLI